MCLHKPSFEEEEDVTEGNQSWFDGTRGSVIPLWIPFVLFFSVLDRQCCATCWGRDLEWVCKWRLWKISLTLILVPAFIQNKKNKVGNKQGLCQFWTLGSLNFIESKHGFIWIINFFISFYSFLFVFSFIHGKMNTMGNLAGWIHKARMHEVCGILT